MNEEIRKLAFQAMSLNQKVSDDSFFVEVSKLNEFEKFAELIVRECADIAKHHVMNISTYGDAEFVGEQIKEHFGIKE
jgi:hypothetical protein